MREAASLLGICVTSLYKLVLVDGSIPSFCIGTRRLISYESLLTFCRSRTNGQHSPGDAVTKMPLSQVSSPASRGVST